LCLFPLSFRFWTYQEQSVQTGSKPVSQKTAKIWQHNSPPLCLCTLKSNSILLTPSRFTTPKVNTILPPTTTPTVVVSDMSSAGGDVGTTSEPTFEPTALHKNSWQAKKSQPAPAILHPKADLPIDDEADMDIILNLEGDEDPQHSFESSKKQRF